MPGVIDIPQGAWFDPDENGVDRGGCVNVLTSQRWTPFAFATAQHTIMVEVERTVEGRRWTVLDGLRSMVNGRNLK
jgi:anaerobic selenocysteine-containing dehydrogenase